MSRHHPAMPAYVFRVRILGGFYAPPGAPSIWREVELVADQTLAELGEHIPAAFGFDDDHLWSFFLSGKPWDRASEYARLPDPPIGGRKRGADDLPVGDAPARKEFLFLFDYGDEWYFGVKLVRTGEVEPGAGYPRAVAGQGEAPPQYPDLDDEDDRDGDETLFPQFAPVELAPLPQLQAAAAAAPTVRRLRALVEWLGEGRKLTGAGNLTLADGKELARLLGLADPDQPAGPRVRSAQDITGLAASVLPLLDRVLPLTDMVDSAFPGGLAQALLDLLSMLYAPDKPVTVGQLAGHFWEGHVESLLDEQTASRLELWRLATAVETAQYLGLLHGLGMVELGGGSDAELVGVAVDLEPGSPATDAYLSLPAEQPSRLTPLGTWWANGLLRQAGAVAPVIGELAAADAATRSSPQLPNPQVVKAARKAAFKLRSSEPQ